MSTKTADKAALDEQPLTPNFTVLDYSKFFLAGALCCTM